MGKNIFSSLLGEGKDVSDFFPDLLDNLINTIQGNKVASLNDLMETSSPNVSDDDSSSTLSYFMVKGSVIAEEMQVFNRSTKKNETVENLKIIGTIFACDNQDNTSDENSFDFVSGAFQNGSLPNGTYSLKVKPKSKNGFKPGITLPSSDELRTEDSYSDEENFYFQIDMYPADRSITRTGLQIHPTSPKQTNKKTGISSYGDSNGCIALDGGHTQVKKFWDQFGKFIQSHPGKIKVIVDIPENDDAIKNDIYGEPTD